MATNVQVETVIDRPRNAVADYAMDWRNDTSWIRAISEARLVTDGPFGVGSRVERVASFLGRRIEYVNEVVELEPGARLVMRSEKAPFPMKVTTSSRRPAKELERGSAPRATPAASTDWPARSSRAQ
jgi:hypothetical protein